MTAAQFEDLRIDEAAEVLAWRFDALCRSGFDLDAAAVLAANVEVDLTSLEALERLRTDLADRGIVLGLARVKQDLLVELEASGVLDRVGRGMVFPTLPTAVAAFRARDEGPERRVTPPT